MSGAYYNEFDPFAAEWLRKLIGGGHIAAGDVDTRSITEVKADDLKKYTQCHFFAGIGGWSAALRLAMWPDDRPVWTGSAPCQPFSSAGNQKGKADERHLFPVWLGLIRECRPPVIFGEQVASAIAHGWLDDVYQGLETEDYAVGAAVLPACSVGSPHRRDRLWFVAHAQDARTRGCSNNDRPSPRHPASSPTRYGDSIVTNGDLVANPSGLGQSGQRELSQCVHTAKVEDWSSNSVDDDGANSWRLCADGKTRLVEPSIPLLAHGVPNRVGKLRGYGNAIVPQVAAEFIRAACHE